MTVIILVVDPLEEEEDLFRNMMALFGDLCCNMTSPFSSTTSNVCTFLEMFCLYRPCLQRRKVCEPGDRSVASWLPSQRISTRGDVFRGVG